jgi:thioredoxin reductase (NADPH)
MKYDFFIVGAGPAGLSAALYAARFGLKSIVLAKMPGGTLANAPIIENWPGEQSISGMELAQKMQEQVKALGVEIKYEEVISIKKRGKNFLIKSSSEGYEAKTVLLAVGAEHRKLGVPGEAELSGKGVSYCAVCDGAFFRDKIVGVVGGNDSAAKEALYLADMAKKVYIIYRKDKIRSEPINAKRVEAKDNIEVINNANVVKINGEKFLNSVTLDREYNGSKELALDGLFVEIGYDPDTTLSEELGVKLNKSREIEIQELSATNVVGLFAAGDATNGPAKQVITAAAEGVLAAFGAYEFLKQGK